MIDIGDFTEMSLEDYLSLPSKYDSAEHFIKSLACVYAYKFHTVRNVLSGAIILPVLKTVYPTVYKTGHERISEMWYDLICARLVDAAKKVDVKMLFVVDKRKQYSPELRVKYQPTQLIARGEFALADVLDI